MTTDYIQRLLELAKKAHDASEALLARVGDELSLTPEELDVISKVSHLVGFIQSLETTLEKK